MTMRVVHQIPFEFEPITNDDDYLKANIDVVFDFEKGDPGVGPGAYNGAEPPEPPDATIVDACIVADDGTRITLTKEQMEQLVASDGAREKLIEGALNQGYGR